MYCDAILGVLRGHGMMYCKTKNILLKNKNHTFAMQKPTFCTPKTILLQRKKGVFENPSI
jgi:hypothetical protein